MLRNIDSQVRKLISSPVSGVNGNYTTLASLGITTQADGKLKLDTVRFNAALAANPGAVSDIFTSTTVSRSSLPTSWGRRPPPRAS